MHNCGMLSSFEFRGQRTGQSAFKCLQHEYTDSSSRSAGPSFCVPMQSQKIACSDEMSNFLIKYYFI